MREETSRSVTDPTSTRRRPAAGQGSATIGEGSAAQATTGQNSASTGSAHINVVSSSLSEKVVGPWMAKTWMGRRVPTRLLRRIWIRMRALILGQTGWPRACPQTDCTRRGKLFKDEDSLVSHLGTCRPKLTCHFCDEKLSRSDSLQRHLMACVFLEALDIEPHDEHKIYALLDLEERIELVEDDAEDSCQFGKYAKSLGKRLRHVRSLLAEDVAGPRAAERAEVDAKVQACMHDLRTRGVVSGGSAS